MAGSISLKRQSMHDTCAAELAALAMGSSSIVSLEKQSTATPTSRIPEWSNAQCPCVRAVCSIHKFPRSHFTVPSRVGVSLWLDPRAGEKIESPLASWKLVFLSTRAFFCLSKRCQETSAGGREEDTGDSRMNCGRRVFDLEIDDYNCC